MQDENGLTPAQRELERALRSTRPAGGRVDAMAAAFDAGRASARRQVRFWQAGTTLALLIAVTPYLIPAGRAPSVGTESGLMLADRTERVTATAPPVSEESVLVLQESVSRLGLDGLPAHRLPPARVVRVGDKL